MKKYTYQEIPEMFVDIIPKFKESEEYKYGDMRVAYSAMDSFGNFFVKYINEIQNPEDDLYVQEVFSRINKLYDSEVSDENAIDIIQVQIFELIAQDKKSKETAMRFLHKTPAEGLIAWG